MNAAALMDEQTYSGTSPKKTILLIDDSSEILALQKTILELDGFEVRTAQSGTEAMVVLSEFSEPDLILLDMRMEDMSGTEFLNLLENKRPKIVRDVPIVFVSAMDILPKSRAAGFIRKPSGIDHFLSEVHHFLEVGNHSPYKH